MSGVFGALQAQCLGSEDINEGKIYPTNHRWEKDSGYGGGPRHIAGSLLAID